MARNIHKTGKKGKESSSQGNNSNDDSSSASKFSEHISLQQYQREIRRNSARVAKMRARETKSYFDGSTGSYERRMKKRLVMNLPPKPSRTTRPQHRLAVLPWQKYKIPYELVTKIKPIALHNMHKDDSTKMIPTKSESSNMIKEMEYVKLPTQARPDFGEMKIAPELVSGLYSLGFTKPTEIQTKAIPAIIKDKAHVLIAAETGSGKTLAYLIPIIHLLRKEENEIHELGPEEEARLRRPGRPRCIILVPSRELVTQVHVVLKKLAHHHRFTSVGLCGGQREYIQKIKLQEPVDVIVATPGRLSYYIKNGSISLNEVRHLVIDEADTLFDQGFFDELKTLVVPLLEKRENKLFQVTVATATLPQSVNKMLDDVFPGMRKLATSMFHRTVDTLRQEFVEIRGQRQAALIEVLRSSPVQPTLVFCNTKKSSIAINKFLNSNRIPAAVIHGDVDFKERMRMLDNFRKGEPHILVCTDIISRGMDLTFVKHVISYDFPLTVIDYIHRVGRTARNGAEGKATSLVGRKDKAMAMRIKYASRRRMYLG